MVSKAFEQDKEFSMTNIQKKSLWKAYNRVQRLIANYRIDECVAYLESLVGTLREYTATADLWFNFAMACARLSVQDLEMEALETGLQEHPNDVDLLCAILQCRYSSHEDSSEAEKIAKQLEELPLTAKAPYWRYWTYLAIYYGVKRGDRARAVQLLDEGLRYVRRDALNEYLRTYRRVYIDSAPPVDSAPSNLDEVAEEYEKSINLVADRLKRGLELGVENGYALAIELAILYQEQAYATRREGGQSESLQKALEVLEFAERMFTPTQRDVNFPLHSIYKQKVNVLMGLKRYDEARELLLAMREAKVEFSPVQELQLQRAAIGSGKALDISMNDVAARIKEDDGLSLVVSAKEDPKLATIVQTAAALLGGNNTNVAAQPAMNDEECLQRAFKWLMEHPDGFVQIARNNPPIAELVKYVCRQLES
jgi:tetratricopeptide (TPR) repeat protein